MLRRTSLGIVSLLLCALITLACNHKQGPKLVVSYGVINVVVPKDAEVRELPIVKAKSIRWYTKEGHTCRCIVKTLVGVRPQVRNEDILNEYEKTFARESASFKLVSTVQLKLNVKRYEYVTRMKRKDGSFVSTSTFVFCGKQIVELIAIHPTAQGLHDSQRQFVDAVQVDFDRAAGV